jgi:hypothetical protein
MDESKLAAFVASVNEKIKVYNKRRGGLLRFNARQTTLLASTIVNTLCAASLIATALLLVSFSRVPYDELTTHSILGVIHFWSVMGCTGATLLSLILGCYMPDLSKMHSIAVLIDDYLVLNTSPNKFVEFVEDPGMIPGYWEIGGFAHPLEEATSDKVKKLWLVDHVEVEELPIHFQRGVLIDICRAHFAQLGTS